MRDSLITVFGGSGFLGRHLVRRLADRGARINVAVRDPEAALYLKTMGAVGQITPMAANLRNAPSVARAVAGADVVINLVGILYQRGPQSFKAVHTNGAGLVAKAAAEAGASRLVQVSAIGVGRWLGSKYARSKTAGEKAVKAAFPEATIVRPSILFGPEDEFFNRLGSLVRFTPVLPVFGLGWTRFQPVYAGDVAEAIAVMLERPETAGQTYELGGPRVYTYAELMRRVLRETGRRRLLLPVPFTIAKLAALFLQMSPLRPLLTVDQLKMLQRHNVVSDDAAGFAELGITPTPLDAVLPTYMARYRHGGTKMTPRFG